VERGGGVCVVGTLEKVSMSSTVYVLLLVLDAFLKRFMRPPWPCFCAALQNTSTWKRST